MRILIFLLLLAGALSAPAQSIFDSLYVFQAPYLYFPFGKSAIEPEAQQVIDSVCQLYRRFDTPVRLRITAHTDSIGQPGVNKMLSEKRAAAVQQALRQCGIPESRIDISAFGENQPIASNSTEAGRQYNRRATVELRAEKPMVSFSGRITDKSTGSGVEATLYFRSKTRADSTRTDTTGYYSVRLPKDTVVKMEVQAKDYFFESQTMRIFGSPELYKRYKISPDIQLPPARPGEKIALRNFYFQGGTDVLLKVSEPELPKLLRFLQNNPDMRVEIAGHVNVPGVDPSKIMASDFAVSVSRAKVVYIYLRRNGIAGDRLQYKGYGNSEMLFPLRSASEAEQQQNRRVEIRVLE